MTNLDWHEKNRMHNETILVYVWHRFVFQHEYTVWHDLTHSAVHKLITKTHWILFTKLNECSLFSNVKINKMFNQLTIVLFFIYSL